MPTEDLPIYDSEVNELTVFPNLKAAQDWLKNNELDTSGTTILVPFKDENNKIHFLKPSNFNIISDLNNKEMIDEANKDIRILGEANSIQIHGFFRNIQAAVTKCVPHLNELKEETIELADHGFIIIYEKGEKNPRHDFFNLFEKERKGLIEKIKKAQTNEAPHINQAEFLESLSALALNLDIKQGMCYFFRTDKNGEQHVYREIFRKNPNTKLDRYLLLEAESHESKRVKIKEHKSQNHHIMRFLIDWFKSTTFAWSSALGAGLIILFFLIPLLGFNIAAAVAGGVAGLTFLAINSIGFFKAGKNNATTIERGEPEFNEESEVNSSSQIIQRMSGVFNFFSNKPNKSDALIAENTRNDPDEISTVRAISSVSSVPMAKSSQNFFTHEKENDFNHNYSETCPSLRN